jgi:hypothetical protein
MELVLILCVSVLVPLILAKAYFCLYAYPPFRYLFLYVQTPRKGPLKPFTTTEILFQLLYWGANGAYYYGVASPQDTQARAARLALFNFCALSFVASFDLASYIFGISRRAYAGLHTTAAIMAIVQAGLHTGLFLFSNPFSLHQKPQLSGLIVKTHSKEVRDLDC